MTNVTQEEQALTEAKTLLIRTFPFLAFVVVSAKYTITDNPDIRTMAATVVGQQPQILINPEFLMEKLTCIEERAFVVAHELLHLFYHHLGRQRAKGLNPALWNIATDYFINYLLCDLSSPNVRLPSWGGLFDPRYANMSSDEIYQLILEENDHNITNILDSFGDVGERGNAPFDHVSEVELSADQEANLKAALSASLNSGMMAGDVRNSALVKSLYNLLEPVIPWRDLLRDYVTKSRDEFYTYKRYNSRSTDIIFPSSDGDRINLLFGIDTSGSMSADNLAEGLTELKAIVDDFQTWQVNFVTCEMDVEEVGEYTSEIGDDFTSFSQEFRRGGGTDMNPIIEHAETLDVTPNAIVIITDGYLSQDLISSHIPVIVVVVRGGSTKINTHHQVIHIE